MSFAPVYYHRLKYFLSPQVDLYKNILQRFGDGRVVLDYGCATGFGTLQLIGHENSVIGVDSDREAIDFANYILGNGRLHFSCWDFTKDVAGFRAEVGGDITVLSLITCVEVIEHIEDPIPLLRFFKKILRQDGHIVLSTLNHNSQYRKNNDHITKYNCESFFEMIFKALGSYPELFDFRFYPLLDFKSSITPIVAVWQNK